jgi:hypothetical protein
VEPGARGPQGGRRAAGEQDGRGAAADAVVELEGARGEVALGDVLRGAARVAHALQAHAVLVAPEVRRRVL